jgi:hypothetical protein
MLFFKNFDIVPNGNYLGSALELFLIMLKKVPHRKCLITKQCFVVNGH